MARVPQDGRGLAWRRHHVFVVISDNHKGHHWFVFVIDCTTGGGGRLRGSWDANYPCPPPPLGAFGQQLVAKGVALRRPWAPKAPDAT